MGWASGSELMGEVIETIQLQVNDHDTRKRIYLGLILAFENMDCDTLMECMGPDRAFDEAFEELNPPEPEDG